MYGDIIYDNPANESLINKVQNHACLEITNAIQGRSRERLFTRTLDLNLYKIGSGIGKRFRYSIFLNALTPKYFLDIIPVLYDNCCNRGPQSKSESSQFYIRTKSFNSTFFSFCIKEWNKLDAKIRNLISVSRLKKMNIDFALISGILSIHYALVMSKLKLRVTISCVALCFLNNE